MKKNDKKEKAVTIGIIGISIIGISISTIILILGIFLIPTEIYKKVITSGIISLLYTFLMGMILSD